nr:MULTISPECIES: HEAT repeat domain-containing protein [unclassified Cyanobium]
MVTTVADASRFHNLHPGLSHEEALRILALPVEQLDAGSDRYMAAAHLINFPGSRSEQALLHLLEEIDASQPTRLAKRKAVEVLARLGCKDAADQIGLCLLSDDPYLVENAAWALEQLGCQDPLIQKQMIALLADSGQNRRVLAQSLAGLGVKHALPAIAPLQDDESPGVRGAALAAVATLKGVNERISELAEHLFLSNQMDRQSAVQDVINAGAVELLSNVLQSPVSPVFRMRALRLLWPVPEPICQDLPLLLTLDSLLLDRHETLQLVHCYDDAPEAAFLINELFGTDFSRCYLALQTLGTYPADSLWPLLLQRWLEEGHNDYGAHYFFMRLFGSIGPWGDHQNQVEDLCEAAIHNRRPQFLKSRPAGILSLLNLNPERLYPLLGGLVDPEQEASWECRYAALMSSELMIRKKVSPGFFESTAIFDKVDPDFFAESKRQQVLALLADL